ncbi:MULTISPECIES: tRNA (adenosine(37)-N6)-dimethylallyltransferase MiaA [Pigmentiphaga]|uniref:tRNA dimethylallyltransferase n=1 Tax=Pigmentiphaga daeguensis TaxID=414049 RepID=A0ABN1BEQ2_9BURK|nr:MULTISPECIES: tRNA (adenosine(37)-N6)-dimethylallyltransferase MiaA [unclassified Pigmentiphaga]OVZ66161.1 tRNA (adenosine(37)-N6)-dimethylallyltransferase MiaA [Pigmentiphaga sp. NML030171]
MADRSSPPVLCLMGPTAAGKSAATLALADRWPLEIVNVDSATIYRGMDIGTAKPSQEERLRVPQHLLDIRDPAESFSAGQFRAETLRLIADIRGRGRIPLLAGGTMMYFKALREGLDNLPQADAVLRAQLNARAADIGWPAMHAELARVDPATAARLSPNDSQRIQRALEVHALTGQPMSALLTGQVAPDATEQRYVNLSLEPSERAGLHARIEQRFDAMLEAGLVDEVRRLRARGDLGPELPSIRCVGYRQVWSYLAGDIHGAEMRGQAIAATRQLAKRQITWLRALPDRLAVDCLAPDSTARVIDAAAATLDAAVAATANPR